MDSVQVGQLRDVLAESKGLKDQLKVLELGKAVGTNKIEELPEEDQLDAVSLQTFTILLRTLDEAFKADGLMVPEEHEIPNEG